MIMYSAGPYRKFTDDQGIVHDVQENIDRAKEISARLWKAGHIVLCPHGNTANFEDYIDIPPQQYLDGDIEMLKFCDALYKLPYWEHSEGALGEVEKARQFDLLEYSYPEIPPLHPTEVKCPEQVRAFREILGRMMRTHLKKNADYSPSNILITGQIGVTTRLWDKTARLLNLTGFSIPIDTPLTFTKPRKAQNESLNDTYMDLAVYAIIGKLLLEGKWGK